MTKLDAQGNAATPDQPKPRRTRGPNKPKPPALIEVQTSASMSQTAIVKALTEYATKMLNAETAANMELQVSVSPNGAAGYVTWVSVNEKDAPRIRFVTKETK